MCSLLLTAGLSLRPFPFLSIVCGFPKGWGPGWLVTSKEEGFQGFLRIGEGGPAGPKLCEGRWTGLPPPWASGLAFKCAAQVPEVPAVWGADPSEGGCPSLFSACLLGSSGERAMLLAPEC